VKHATLIILLLTLTAALALGAGNNWRNERPITGLSGSLYVSGSAIAASGGNAVALYERGGIIYYVTSNTGGASWGSETTFPNAWLPWYNSMYSLRPLAVILNGTTIEAVLAASYGTPVAYPGVWYLRSTDMGQSWIEAFLVQATNASDPYDWIQSVSITRCTDTVAQVAWSYYYDDPILHSTTVKHRRKTASGWQPEQVLASYSTGVINADIAGRFKLKPTLTKTAYVVWNNPTNNYIYYVKSTNQGYTWTSPASVENTGPSSYPAVKLKSNLDGFVLWEHSTGIRSKRITGPASVVVAGPNREPRLTADETDSLYMCGTKFADNRVWGNSSLDGYAWTSPTGFKIQWDPNSANANLRHPDVSWTHTDGTMRLFIWNGKRLAPYDHQELWLGVNDLGNPAPPTNLQAVKFCSMPPAFVQVTYTATTALDDSGYNIYKHEPKCGPPWTKLNSDIVTGTVYYDFTIPQSYPECDAYCACYMARSKDLALNEGGDSNTSEVGFCDAPSLPPAILLVAASLGQPTPSTYTQRRGGYLSWGSGKSADVDPDQLEYRIRGLDTSAYYVLDFQYYAPESGRAVAARAGGTLLHGPKAITQEEICIPNLLPKTTYASGTLTFTIEKVEGPNAILGKFRLWKMPDGFQGGGPQSAGLAARSGIQPYLAPPRPNPSTGEVYLGYWLPKAGEATLRVYNTAGQLVRGVDSGQKNAGTHSLVWDGKNATGHTVPNGIYLVRLVSGSVSATQKVTILR